MRENGTRCSIHHTLSQLTLFWQSRQGSGKTLAFVLPMIRHVLDQIKDNPLKAGEGMIALILSPTRELAIQTFDVVKKFTKPTPIR